MQYGLVTGKKVTFFSTSAPVTIKDLINELHDVINWFQLGIYLDISLSDLVKIRADHREKMDDCKTEMLVTWVKQTTDPSWSTVVKALVGIKMRALARKVAVKYGKSISHKTFACSVKGQLLAEAYISKKVSIVKKSFKVNRLSSSDPRPVTGILVLKILVCQTNIFAGKYGLPL